MNNRTYYNKIHYRTRIEARWAIYFDSMGIDFEYTFKHFYLKKLDIYAVVLEYHKKENQYPILFSKRESKDLVVLIGVPDTKVYKVYKKGKSKGIVFVKKLIDKENKLYNYPLEYLETIGERVYMCSDSEKAVHASRAARFETY